MKQAKGGENQLFMLIWAHYHSYSIGAFIRKHNGKLHGLSANFFHSFFDCWSYFVDGSKFSIKFKLTKLSNSKNFQKKYVVSQIIVEENFCKPFHKYFTYFSGRKFYGYRYFISKAQPFNS